MPTSTSPTGPTPARCRSVQGQLRSRRLYRLPLEMLHAARARHARHGGLPALGAGAGGGVADGGRKRPVRARRRMTLMGGPIDTARNPTAVNKLAVRARHRLVPAQRHRAGAVAASGLHARGLSGLPAAHRLHDDESRPAHRRPPRAVLASGRRATATRPSKHREFYDEYLSVMDLTAEFYLQTVEKVFVDTRCHAACSCHRGGRSIRPRSPAPP